MQEKCKICYAPASIQFSAEVLKKYAVNYLKCNNCGFMQTEKPYWLEEAYGSVISSLDIGLITRNIYLSGQTELIIKSFLNPDKDFLDYGGGYGMFVRMMRDKGFHFYRYDTYCENLFAKNFDDKNHNKANSYELVTSFEVFEHLEDPLKDIEDMLKYSSSILFSTELLPALPVTSEKDWWYFLPETGQHIAFYSGQSLKIIADKFNLNIYSLDNSLHLLTPMTISPIKFKLLKFRLYRIILYSRHKRKSLLQDDFNLIRNSI